MRKLVVLVTILSAACSGGGSDSTQGGTPTAATPTFSVPAGVKNAPISVAISTTTAGAAIHYTTNGVDPTAASSTYGSALSISTATTVKAIATASGYNASAVATAAYTFQAATPTFSVDAGTYTAAQNVALSTVTPGATIYYTTDGSTPTTSSTAYAGTPISLSVDPSTTTIKAIAVRAGFADSGVASGTYTIDSTATPAATPTFSPLPGTYTSIQNVTISTTTGGATIYYTTDGTDPTVASSVYATPVAIASTKTLKAIATATGHTASAIQSGLYTINLPQAATPTFSPTPGAVASGQVVTISSTTPGAVIHCTTNGTAATAASPVCTTVTVTTATTIRAVATATGYTTSAEATGSYTISGGGVTCGSGTDFPTVCACIMQKLTDLMVTCEKLNPDLVAAMMAGGGNCADMQKEFDAGLMTYDPTAGAACKADTLAMTCANLVSSGGGANPAPSCDSAVVGNQVNGTGASSLCYSSDNCASGFCTSEMTSTCPGHCQAYATAGQDCSSAQCAAGLGCDYSGTSLCVALRTAGNPCPCQDGLFCDSGGICRAPKTSGSCFIYNQGECAVGYGCLMTSFPAGNCAALAGPGQNCTSNPCGMGYYCSSGTCVAGKSSGSCGPTAGYTGYAPECWSMYCVSGACQALSPDATCTMP